jgi:hypothetical protein
MKIKDTKPGRKDGAYTRLLGNEELLAEIIFRSGSTKGLPVKAKCFQCFQEF